MQSQHKKCNEYIYEIAKNTTKNRLGATENAPNLFYTPLIYTQRFQNLYYFHPILFFFFNIAKQNFCYFFNVICEGSD